jgi:hypothetical protein
MNYVSAGVVMLLPVAINISFIPNTRLQNISKDSHFRGRETDIYAQGDFHKL